MINRELTNLYLSDLDLLTEALYFCWTNSFCIETDQLNKEKLKEQILSYGLYDHKYATKKEIPINFINKLEFKTIVWVNEFVDKSDDIIWCGYTELYKQVIVEIENNLFVLKLKSAQIAYANILLRNLDKSHIHKQKLSLDDRNMKYKETFEIVLNRKFLSENKDTIQDENGIEKYPNYNLTARLINHLDFIDKLIELFKFFDIDLLAIAEEFRFNLFIFKKRKLPLSFPNEIENNILPKFDSPLSDDCLINIMQLLFQKKKLNNQNVDTWLYWFNRKYINIPEPMSWSGSNTLLSNIIQHLCGECCISTIKKAFDTTEFVKPTRKEYELSRLYKEIEQIITITMKKK